jgi:hypothetical protein
MHDEEITQTQNKHEAGSKSNQFDLNEAIMDEAVNEGLPESDHLVTTLSDQLACHQTTSRGATNNHTTSDGNGPVSVSKTKSVQFASTKILRQYDADAVTNFPEEELDVDFSAVSKLRSRKASKSSQAIKAEAVPSFSVANLL